MDVQRQDYVRRREEMLSRVRRILIERLNVRRAPDEIDPDTALFGSGLGLDSVDLVELVVACEAEFRLKFGRGASGRARLRTVNNVVDFVMAQEEKPRVA